MISKIGMSVRFIDSLLSKLEETDPIPLVGCADHCIELTQKIVNFYVIMRCNFLCKNHNKICAQKKKRARSFKKMSKY